MRIQKHFLGCIFCFSSLSWKLRQVTPFSISFSVKFFKISAAFLKYSQVLLCVRRIFFSIHIFFNKKNNNKVSNQVRWSVLKELLTTENNICTIAWAAWLVFYWLDIEICVKYEIFTKSMKFQISDIFKKNKKNPWWRKRLGFNAMPENCSGIWKIPLSTSLSKIKYYLVIL